MFEASFLLFGRVVGQIGGQRLCCHAQLQSKKIGMFTLIISRLLFLELSVERLCNA